MQVIVYTCVCYGYTKEMDQVGDCICLIESTKLMAYLSNYAYSQIKLKQSIRYLSLALAVYFIQLAK